MRIPNSVCGLALSLSLLPSVGSAELLYGLTPLDQLATFDSAAPGAPLTISQISGLGLGESLLGLDLRPADNGLYAFSTAGKLYELQSAGATYTANLVGPFAPGPISLSPTGAGLDFNPVVDLLRYVQEDGLNLRIDPDTGLLASADAPIAPYLLAGVAYANNVDGAATTSLYGIDRLGQQLVVSTNPNAGLYVAVGPLGIFFPPSPVIAFDISGVTGTAYMSLDQVLYTVNLSTGSATAVGAIGAGPLRGLTAAGVGSTEPIPEPSTWALLIGGFALAGAALRRRRELGHAT
jgi:hypothetical protein